VSEAVECVELSPVLLPAASELLSGYMAGWQDQTPAACAEALARLLQFPGARFVLARLEGVPCGFASLQWGWTTTRGVPILRVQDLFVAEAYRRRGVARALLGYASKLGRNAGAHRLQLETDSENKAAQHLYESFGFTHIQGKEIYMLFL
jgi:ribosomal protein S18 acetylase RimI-like enzyme